eukprot:7103165-Alexandrium_andersonii.AAC.1
MCIRDRLMRVSRNPRLGGPPSGARSACGAARCRPSRCGWSHSAGCTGVRCAGADADDVLEEVGEGRPEVAPEEALAVGVGWDVDEALL